MTFWIKNLGFKVVQQLTDTVFWFLLLKWLPKNHLRIYDDNSISPQQTLTNFLSVQFHLKNLTIQWYTFKLFARILTCGCQCKHSSSSPCAVHLLLAVAEQIIQSLLDVLLFPVDKSWSCLEDRQCRQCSQDTMKLSHELLWLLHCASHKLCHAALSAKQRHYDVLPYTISDKF